MASVNSSRWIATIPSDWATRSQVERLLIGEIFEVLTQGASLRSTLETITAAVCTRLNLSSCAILLEREGADLLLIEGATGLSQSYVEAVNERLPVHIQDLDLSESPSSVAFRTGRPVIIEDTETDPEFRRWRRLARQQGYRSLVSLPLVWEDHPIGTLCCYQGEPRHYHDDELETLAIAATQVAIAIQIVRLVDTQQRTIARLRELTLELNAQRRLLERAAEIHGTLMQLVLDNQGIPAIAAALARVVRCPVLVQDQFYQVLASVNAYGEPVTDLLPLSRTSFALHPTPGQEATARAPFEIPATARNELEQPRAVAPIIAGRTLLGHVSLVLPELPAAPLHLRALGQAATVLALEMVKEHLGHEIEVRVRRGFADDLVAGRYDDVEQMRDRARYLGYDLSGPFQVLTFDIDQFGRYVAENRLSEARIDALRRQFSDTLVTIARNHSPRAALAGRHDRLALILSRVPTDSTAMVEAIIAAARERLKHALPGLTVSVGIGQVQTELDRVRVSYQEADQALFVLRRLGGKARTVSFSELGVARLLLQSEDPTHLIEFARARLGQVLRYDAQHSGILVEALEAYLGANQTISTAARQLNLHPNTLRYRLHKVEDLLNVSLQDIAVLLDIQFATLILRLVGQPASTELSY